MNLKFINIYLSSKVSIFQNTEWIDIKGFLHWKCHLGNMELLGKNICNILTIS